MSVNSAAQARPASEVELSPKPNWIVPVAAHETASQVFEPQTEAAAHAAFSTHGRVLLRGVFAAVTVDADQRLSGWPI